MNPFSLLLLFTLLAFAPAPAQQPDGDVNTLPPEDQMIVKALKFKPADAASIDTRGNTFIKAELPVNNSGPNESVLGKLNLEVRLLFRTPDKEWSVLKCQSDFAIKTKGMSDVHFSFSEQNKLIEQMTGDRKAKAEDSYTIIRYAGVKIYESEPSKASRFPVEWWKQEGKLARQAAGPGKKGGEAPGGEFQALRAAAVRDLRAHAWRTYEQSLTALNVKYCAAIDKAMKTSQSHSLLDEALELRKEKDTVTKTNHIPRDPPSQNAPALIALRSAYVSALSALKTVRSNASIQVIEDYNQKTELLIERLTRDGKLDEAKSARDGKTVPLIADD